MKKIYTFLILFSMMSSCKSPDTLHNNKDHDSYKIHEESWQYNFKNQVFIACLQKLYPPDFRSILDSVDGTKAAIYDRLDYNREVLSIADSLATEISRKINHSSLIEGRKVILNACLDYRTSKELDRFADSLYKVVNHKQSSQR